VNSKKTSCVYKKTCCQFW